MVSILACEIKVPKTMSKKNLKDGVSIPFFALEDEIRQNQAEIKKVIKEVILKVLPKDKDKTALIIGTSLVDWYLVDAINDLAYEKKKPFYSKKRSIDSYAKDISQELGLSGFTMSINTACTSSANALLEAKNLLEANLFKYVIVVGLEIFSSIMSSGFYSMELLSSTKAKPFKEDRDGFVLGEGVGAMLLGKKSSSWQIVGGFSNCNSETITGVSISGDECAEVMQKALQNCSLHVEDILALKAHATGSFSNDEAEMNAIKNVFSKIPEIITLKEKIGHTIGASGVLEIALLMQLKEDCKDGFFMCNYFGFGGNNTSLILRKSR